MKSAAKDGVRFSFHITPAALSFTLAFLSSLVMLIAWLVDKPSRAEVKQQIDTEQKPIITRLDDIKDNVSSLRDEFHHYVRVTLPPDGRDGTYTPVPIK